MDGQSTDGTEYSIVEEHDLDEPDWGTSWDGTPRPPTEVVCSVAEALEADDEIIINNRSRPLTVLGFEKQYSGGAISGSDWPYHILWLRGNGTEHRLRWSHRFEYLPRLHKESELETTESYSIKRGEPRTHTRATGLGTRVRWLKPVGVSEGELPGWVLQRSIDGLENHCVQPGKDRNGGDSQ